MTFLSAKRISEQEFKVCRFKMKEDGCSVGTSIGKVFRSSSAELFHSSTCSLNLCFPPSCETCDIRDVLGEERILPRTRLVFGGQQSGGGGMLYGYGAVWVLPRCFVLGILPEYYFYFRSKKNAKVH